MCWESKEKYLCDYCMNTLHVYSFTNKTKNQKQKQFIAPIFLLPENQIWLWGHYSNIENGKKKPGTFHCMNAK